MASLSRESNPFVRIEFTHDAGRVDILAVGQSLRCFEIKSDTDSLARVQSQVTSFSSYCEELTFVAGPRLAIRLLDELPLWCGVWLAYRTTAGILLSVLRAAKTNPRADARATLHILSVAELRRLSRLVGHPRPKRKAHAIDSLAPTLPLTTIRRYVTASIRRRADARPVVQPMSNGDSRPLGPT
jgi:hypothetical protein